MRLRLSIAVAAIAFVFAILPAHVKTQAPRDARRLDYVNGLPVADGEVLVRLRTGTAAERAAIDAIIDADDDHPIGTGVWRRVHSASRTVHLMLAALRGRGEILDVEPNYIVQVADRLPNDPSMPWGLLNTATPGADIHAANAWDVSTGSAAYVVGVVDTGVDYTHPDLAGNMWTAPQQFTVTVAGKQVTCPAGSHGFNAIAFRTNDTANICNPKDDNNHGTHVSGTIGAVGNNGLGVVGVNWTTRIMGLKFLDAGGSGLTSDAVSAIDFAIQTKAAFANSGNTANVRVLSNSWGGGGFAGSLSSAIDRAYSADILFVAAAGNDGSNNDAAPVYPASYPQGNVVAVAATTETDDKAGFSNYGVATVQLGAPGNNVYSTIRNSAYGLMSGTSMATPHVSGAAVLILSACSLTTDQLKSAMLNNADAIPSLTGYVSNGRLNVDAAMRSCANVPAVAMTSPAEGASFIGPASSIPLAATASSSRGIAKVEFYKGAQLLGTSNTAPYGGTWANVPGAVYTLTAKAYDALGVATTSAPVHITVSNGLAPTNVALASNGARALASSTFNSGYAASGAINGDRKGAPWGNGGGWNDGTPNVWPDWLEVDFAGTHTINEVDVFSVQDNFTAPVDPTPTMTFTQYGLTDFTVQYWDGTQWVPVPGGAIAGNNLVWRKLTFAAVTTAKIRVLVTGSLNNWTRVTEIEAYQSAPGSGTLPPTVSLTAPTDGATFATVPATIALTATATASNGASIDHVEFYQGATLVNSTTASPYQFSWTNVSVGNYSLTAKAYDTVGGSSTSTPVHVTVTNGGATRTNVALASNGATALASSTFGSGYAASGAINGDRKGALWGNGGGWNDGTANAWPDWLEVDFAGAKTITEVDVFGVQDNFTAPVDPTPTMTFTQYGLTDFTVQYWDGAQWLAVPGGAVSGNNLVWRQVTFAAITTAKIRVLVTGALNTWSRVAEIEAYTAGNPALTNVALASNGGTALGSSTFGTGYSASGAINGDRKGASWGNGGGWNDSTANAWPDWLEVDFAGTKTISEVDVFSVQDNFTAPVEPTPSMTFTQYGLTDFTVQYWDGTQWVTVPGGGVSGNNLVWRQVTFAAVTTAKIRILVTGALNTWSRVAEVEAY